MYTYLSRTTIHRISAMIIGIMLCNLFVVSPRKDVMAVGKKQKIYGIEGKKYSLVVNKATRWKSANSKVVAVNKKGIVTLKKVGTTTITVYNKRKISSKIQVTVVSDNWVKYIEPGTTSTPTPNGKDDVVPTPSPNGKDDVVPTPTPNGKDDVVPTPTPSGKDDVVPTPSSSPSGGQPTVAPTFNPDVFDKGTFANELARLINEERVAYGVAQLKTDWDLLNQAAWLRADEMASTDNYLKRPDGKAGYTVLSDVGIIEGVHSGTDSEAGYGRYEFQLYNAVHNGTFYNRENPARAFAYFQSNTREDMLESGPTHMGVGVARSASGVYYWYVMYLKKK